MPSAIMSGTDALVHLAWRAGPGYVTSRKNALWVESSLALATAFAAAGGSRMVLAGTCAEYDWSTGTADAGIAESAPTVSSSPYAAAKLELLDRLQEVRRLTIAWARIFWLVGPGERSERLVPSVTMAAVRNEAIIIKDSEDVRDFLDVRELARGVSLLVSSPLAGVVNLASGEGRRVAEVARLAAEIAGNPSCVEFDAGPATPRYVVADTTRARQELGFHPALDLQPAVAASVHEWKGRV